MKVCQNDTLKLSFRVSSYGCDGKSYAPRSQSEYSVVEYAIDAYKVP
jgi:hypothetical protein